MKDKWKPDPYWGLETYKIFGMTARKNGTIAAAADHAVPSTDEVIGCTMVVLIVGIPLALMVGCAIAHHLGLDLSSGFFSTLQTIIDES